MPGESEKPASEPRWKPAVLKLAWRVNNRLIPTSGTLSRKESYDYKTLWQIVTYSLAGLSLHHAHIPLTLLIAQRQPVAKWQRHEAQKLPLFVMQVH
jgi:hypothetical protein